jgi:hypothetical protein
VKEVVYLRKYLFRERLIRVILKEWREKKDPFSQLHLRSICYKYDLSYDKSRNFLSRLKRDNVVVMVKPVPANHVIKAPIVFLLAPGGVEKLEKELKYASII